MNLDENKKSVSDFISKLEEEERRKKSDEILRNKKSTKLNKIEREIENAKELTTQDIFAKIYKDALPVESHYKSSIACDLDNGVTSFIKNHCGSDSAYQYISEKCNKGIKSAIAMNEAVTEAVNAHFRKFYENIDETDIDDIKLSSDERKTIVDKINADMDYDEVSAIINDHVKQTVQDEITRTKQEDDHMKELEETLAANEQLTTESAIDAELTRMGEGKREYVPSLFTGIMINKTNVYTESGDLDEDHIQKKAFFESVKEYTLWDMVHTLGLEDYTKNDIAFRATNYARCVY